MTRRTLASGGVVAVAVAVLALLPREGEVAPPPVAPGPARSDGTRLVVRSGVASTAVGPASFCARPNGEPVALACGVVVSFRAGPGLPVRPGGTLDLRFAARLAQVWVQPLQVSRSGQLRMIRYRRPLLATTDPRVFRLRWPRTASPRTDAIGVSVAYAEGVRLRLGDRLSRPFRHASAEFVVPVSQQPILDERPGSELAAVRGLARRFAEAIEGARPDRLCRVLRGEARRQQDCTDIGPRLQLAVDHPEDVRIVRVARGSAVLHIPGPARRAEPARAKDPDDPQVLRARKLGARWYVTDMDLHE